MATDRKLIVLGVDGMDPRLAKHCLEKGMMPNLQKFIDKGSAREDLMLMGGVPTVTPPMWTTLATGANPGTHGITAFFNQDPNCLHRRVYALDSRECKAEPLWNVFAEEGKKTLVWHWPGSSWPPTSDSPNLSVVDGTQPMCVNMGTAMVDWEIMCEVDAKYDVVKFTAHNAVANDGAGCIITGLDDVVEKDTLDATEKKTGLAEKLIAAGAGSDSIFLDHNDEEIVTLGKIRVDDLESPLSEPRKWAAAPEGAKEFVYMTSEGYVRRPCLWVKEEDGTYAVYVYKTKHDTEPMVIIPADGEMHYIYDQVIKNGETKDSYRFAKVLDLAEDGTSFKFWMSMAYDTENKNVWHPQELYHKVIDNVGPVPPLSIMTGSDKLYADELLMKGWDAYCQWQADALMYLKDSYEVIFSHLHNIDGLGHQTWHFANYRKDWDNDVEFYQNYLERVYVQTDNYLGEFLPLLDEGWTVMIVSDHGLISEENHPPGLGEGGANASVMRELGYTVLKKDENGNDIREIDYTKTKAIASRGCYININLKGRNPEGIVEPEDKYELERQIITDLYNYKDPITGKRVVAIALRNKDAVVLGLDGPDTGDIVYFMDEGFNIIHMDSLATFNGHFATSVSPIFVAAGNGIKEHFTTKRVIHTADVTPTLAVLGGVRMPAECEGAPVYQILED